MLMKVNSLCVMATLAASLLLLSVTVFKTPVWHNGLVGCAAGICLGIAWLASKSHPQRDAEEPLHSGVDTYRITP